MTSSNPTTVDNHEPRLLTPPPEVHEPSEDAVLDDTTALKQHLRNTENDQLQQTASARVIAHRDRSQTISSDVPQASSSQPEDKTARRATDTPEGSVQAVRQNVLKLSSAQIKELVSSPGSIPSKIESTFLTDGRDSEAITESDYAPAHDGTDNRRLRQRLVNGYFDSDVDRAGRTPQLFSDYKTRSDQSRPKLSTRGLSEPFTPQKGRTDHERGASTRKRNTVSRRTSNARREEAQTGRAHQDGSQNSPSPPSLPLPPFSIPTYLQLELSAERPSPLFINASALDDIPYESSRVKFERLLNFVMLPPQLEQVLVFGTLTCLDAWLYMFTILPLRFLTSILILVDWIYTNISNEVRYIAAYVYQGLGRLWRRQRNPTPSTPKALESESDSNPDPRVGQIPSNPQIPSSARRIPRRASELKARGHRRSRSTPSLLQPNHKADLLQGLLIIVSCAILTRFDASRMYHSIRGQAAIKLYVIYNVLEVFDRLFSALGQDILECLFSRETLERKANGRSKIVRPFGLFLMALLYCVLHATALFYQVITLNVAVNSYSNALLTLLMSNQFVEIKGTVFKRIEKENLFQLTCADIVERFQLWLMLLIIALRNIVEVGGLSVSLSSTFPFSSTNSSPPASSNTSSWFSQKVFGFLPNSFTIMPSLLPFQVLGPFLLVLGSEMLVDWVKHAYITKFNATSATIYGRFFDVLAKDYYSHAFAEQTLTRRLGLPLIPLACLFIRATLQTYHMFLATNISPPLLSTATSLAAHNLTAAANATSSPALARLDAVIRRALDASSFGGAASVSSFLAAWTLDDAIALATMLVVFLALYFLLLALKLVLGMLLLSWARTRYAGMKRRESARYVELEARRTGAYSTAEVGETRRGIIYEGDEEGLRRVREREARAGKDGKGGLEAVERYNMLSKRIW